MKVSKITLYSKVSNNDKYMQNSQMKTTTETILEFEINDIIELSTFNSITNRLHWKSNFFDLAFVFTENSLPKVSK